MISAVRPAAQADRSGRIGPRDEPWDPWSGSSRRPTPVGRAASRRPPKVARASLLHLLASW